jgi:hypothetical protein
MFDNLHLSIRPINSQSLSKNQQLVKPCPVPFDQFDVKRAQARQRILNNERELSNQAFHRKLQELQRIFNDLQETRDRDAVYLYLRAIYLLVRPWKLWKRTRTHVRRVQEFACKKVDRNAEPFATVIRYTSDVDAKTRSKWSRLLRFVERFKPRRQPFKQFVKERGGINGCASRFARCMGPSIRRHST